MNSLIIVSGLPGVGKTTYAKNLAAELGAVVLDVDESTEILVKLALSLANQDPLDRDSSFFKQHFRQPIYDQLFHIAKQNLMIQDVIVSGPFTREMQNSDWPDLLAKEVHAQVNVHYLVCDEQQRLSRIKSRGNPRDQLKLKDWESHLHYYPKNKIPLCKHLLIDTSN